MKPVVKQPSVRVNLKAKQKLDELQSQTELSQPALLDRAIELLARELRAQQFADDLSALIGDDEALRKYKEISAVFEGAAADGLRNK